jgi:Plant transposon protein
MMNPFEEFRRRVKSRREMWALLETNDDCPEDDSTKAIKFPVKRKVYARENYRDSCWFKFLQRDLSDLDSRDSKIFRNRFTVPYELFTQLLSFAENWFPQAKFDCCGREVPPIALKLLGSLRMLGKGCSWDLLYELSGISADVHRRWTLAFVDKFSKDMYSVYVHGPRNSEDLNAVTSLYAACGFPGCVGSTDCVHIRWEMCPSIWMSAFRNGKHDYCSIAYEMTVDHSKRFQATTIGHYGTTSDKTIVKF